MSDARYEPSPELLAMLRKVVQRASRAGRLSAEDAEDFEQSVHLKLLERNYDVLQRFSGRSTLQTYLFVVVKRLMLDWMNATRGKWRPSVAAEKLGPWAIRLERLIHRDGYTTDEAIETIRSAAGAPTIAELRGVAAQLSPRVRRREVPDSCVITLAAAPADDPVEGAERQRGVRSIVSAALRQLSRDDRLLVCLRYGQGQSIQTIAQRLRVPPAALYRRHQLVLRALRATVRREGVTPLVAAKCL